MATKKCNCKKCGYCKQIIPSIQKVNCEIYSITHRPTHCDKFISIEYYEIQQKAKEDYDRQVRHMEYVWSIIENKQRQNAKIFADKMVELVKEYEKEDK